MALATAAGIPGAWREDPAESREDGIDRRIEIIAEKRMDARQEFIKQDAEREDVGAAIDGLPWSCSGDMFAGVPVNGCASAR